MVGAGEEPPRIEIRGSEVPTVEATEEGEGPAWLSSSTVCKAAGSASGFWKIITMIKRDACIIDHGIIRDNAPDNAPFVEYPKLSFHGEFGKNLR